MTNFSQYQERIFTFVTTGRGSAVVIAVAGSGKTTTIVECANRIPAALSCGFVAFNKSIAEELKTRLPKHVKSQTLNGMGFSAWARFCSGKLTVDGTKVRGLIDKVVPQVDFVFYAAALRKLIGLAKSIGLVPEGIPNTISLVRDTDQAWFDLMEHHDVEFEEGADPLKGLEYARAVLKLDIEQGQSVVDFDDQLYLPVIYRARFWQNDWLFVDEAQDVNAIQRAMLRRALKPGGRLIAVGDPAQAIYGFRGADTDAIENIKAEFGAIELPLTISYRCPQAVVREAQQYVAHIEASPAAPEGVVKWVPLHSVRSFQASDAVLCRNTAPLVDLAYKCIRAQVGCRVLGREIGQGLVSLINKMKSKSVPLMVQRLEMYLERETAKFMAKKQEERAAALADKVETIRVFVDQLSEVPSQRTVPNLIRSIESLFSDDNRASILTLCTVHKSKGLEWQRVFVYEPALMPSSYARQAWQKQQEVNLQYVAVTRSKSELYYITKDGVTIKEVA
jgi:superfamily I DNA/RNA helicase